METYTIKFPSGINGSELMYYMGVDWPQHELDADKPRRQMIDICNPGKKVSLTKDQVIFLISEVDNMLDIKQDHIYAGSDWTNLNQYHLRQFMINLKKIIE